MYPKSSSQWFSRGLLVAALLLMLVFSVLPAAAQSRAETYHAITFYAPGAIDPETHEPWATEGKVENVLDGTAIRFPQHPTRTGYRYMGWYTEPNGGGTLVEGDVHPTGDMSLYAYFVPSYTITFNAPEAAGQGRIWPRHEEILPGESLIMPTDPFYAGHILVGWNTEADGSGEFVSAGTVPTGDMDLYAIFREIRIYLARVEFYYEHNGQEITFGSESASFGLEALPYVYEDMPPYVSVQGIEDMLTPTVRRVTITEDDLTGAVYNENKGLWEIPMSEKFRIKYVPANAEYTIVHMLKDLEGDSYTAFDSTTGYGLVGDEVLPDFRYDVPYAIPESRSSVLITQESGQEVPVYYTRADYVLRFNTRGGTPIDPVTAPYGTNISLSSYQPARTGYTFAGWEDENGNALSSVTLNDETTVYARWNPAQVGYTVIYLFETYDDAGTTATFEYDNSERLTALTGATIHATDSFIPDKSRTGWVRDDEQNAASSVVVEADGSSVLRVYYKLQDYTIRFRAGTLRGVYNNTQVRATYNGETTTGLFDYNLTVRLGQNIASVWPNGLTGVRTSNGSTVYFVGWQKENEGSIYATKRHYVTNEMLPATGTTVDYYGYWIQQAYSGTVTYWLQNANDDGYTRSEEYSESVNLTGTGSQMLSKEIVGFTYDHGNAETTYEDSGGVWDFYYNRNTYTIDYYDGDRLLDSKSGVKLDQNINTSEYNWTPTGQPGYTWDGWKNKNGENYNFGIMPPHNLVLYASWIAPEYTVSFDMNCGIAATPADFVDQTVEIMHNATRPASEPTRKYYTFTGWYTNPECSTGGTCTDPDAASCTVVFDFENTPITADTQLYAGWRLNTLSYTVHYVDEDGNTLLDDVVNANPDFRPGQTVTETPWPIAGYTPNTTSITYTLGYEDNEITFVYARNPEYKHYTVYYVLEENHDVHVHEPLEMEVPGERREAEQYIHSDFEIDRQYMVDNGWEEYAYDEQGEIRYYPTYLKVSLPMLSMNPEENVMYFYFARYNSAHFTVNYLDMDGNKIADTEENLVYVGDTYDVNKKHISGYTYYEHYDVTNGVWNPPEYDEIEGGENITINIYYKKTLDIYATDKQKQYDGTPLVSSFAEGNYTAIGLKDGHSITNLQFLGSQTDAGQSPTTPHDVTISGPDAGRDFYIVNYHPGTLTVTRNDNPPVVITIDPDRWTGIIYDGNTYSIGFTNPNKTLDDYVNINNEVYKNLYQQEIYNRILEDSLNREILISQKDAGTYTITPETIESWIGGLPGLNNFSSVTLQVRPCELEILPKPLTVTTGSAVGHYPEDAPLRNSEASLDGLIASEEDLVTVTATGVREEIGSSPNTYTINWGTVKQDNYTITEKLGELLLTGDVVIEVQDMTKVYNGLEQEGYGILNVSLTGDGSTIEQVKSITGLASGDVLTITAGHQKAKGTDVGVYTGTLEDELVYTVRDRNGLDVTDAYENITVRVGKLTITPATGLTVNAVDYEGVYDGNAHPGGGTANITEGTTYTYSTDGGTTWSSTIPSITDVGEMEYMVKASNKNYQDATDTGTLKVNPRPILLTVQDRTLPYNGSEQYGWNIDSVITGNGGLVEREHYTMSGLLDRHVMYVAEGDYTPSHGTEVGTYNNGAGKLDPEFTILDPTGRDVTDNYTPSAVAGKLTITTNSGEVILTAPSDSKTYDGTALTADGSGEKKVTASGLPAGFTVRAFASGSQTDAGSSANKVNSGWRIFDAAGKDETASFSNVRTVDGTLTVNKRPLTISTGSDVKYYDGTPLTNDEKEVEGLVNGETVTVTTTGSQTEIGSSSNTYTLTWGTAKESNYTVTSNPGTLQVLANTAAVVLTAPSGSKTYDGTALTIDGTGTRKVTATGLPAGFTVEATASGSQTDVGNSPNVVNDGWIIRNAAGVDETASFTNVKKVDGTLTVNPKQVTITTGTANKEYDGKPLTNAEANITGLVNGQTATVTATGSQTEVGSSSNTYSIDWGTTNKDNYTVREQLGILTVTENTAEVTLTAPSATKVYDGTPLTCKGTTDDNCGGEGPKTVTATGLPEGFTVDATASGSKTHAGTEPNVVNDGYKILNAAGEDKTANFTNVKKTDGTLTVTKAPLTIETGSAEKKYDGTALRSSDYTVTGLVNGETVTVRPNGSQTAVGESDNTYTMTWDTARDSDYEVTDKLGKLKVTAMDGEVVLTAPSDTKAYDGTALTADGTGTKKVTWTGLPTGFTVTATATGSQTDAGSSPNVVNDGYKILDAAGTDVTGNYTNVKKVDGTLTVTPKEVTITTGSDSKEYDGTPLTNADANITGLVNGETATVTATGSQTEVGESDNTYTLTWGTAKEGNYTVKEQLGTLTVTKNDNAVVLKAPSAEKTYDGTALTAPGTEDNPVTATGLPDGFTVEASASGTITNAGERPNVVNDGWVIKDGNGNDVTANFTNVTTEDGKLTVKKAPLTIKTGSAEKEYDGTPLRSAEYDVDGLVNGEIVTVIPNGSQTAVGSSDNTYTMTWDTARVVNYEVTDELGTLTVTESTKVVKVIAPSAEKEYDGTALTAPGNPDNPIKTENLPAGHRIQATITGSQTDAGESANVIDDGWKILNGAGEDVTAYFTNKTKENGTLKVTPKEVTITTGSAEKEYDGTALTDPEVEIEGLIDGESVTLTATGSQTEVGSSDNTYSITWDNAKEINYTVTDKLGKLTVTKTDVEVFLRAGSAQKTYDGTELTRSEVTATGLPDGFTVEATASGSQTDACDMNQNTALADCAPNVVNDGYKILNAAGEDKTANFTKVTKVDGTLTVNPAPLRVETESATKKFDGTALTAPGSVVGLVSGQSATVRTTGSQTEVGSSRNTYDEITWGPNTDKNNYFIAAESLGTLTVVPQDAEVTIIADSATKTYDGTALTDNGVTWMGLPAGYTVTCTMTDESTRTDAGETDNVIATKADDKPDCVIKSASGTDETDSFSNIHTVNGILHVNKRAVTIKTGSDTKVYDGTALTDPEVEPSNFVESDVPYMTLETDGSQTEIGTSNNTYKLTWAAGNDKSGNYTITDVLGTLTVTPNANRIVITAPSARKVYDGTPLTADGNDPENPVIIENLPGGFTVFTVVAGTLTNAGVADNEIISYQILNSAGENKTTSFTSVRLVNGALNVTKRPVTITTETANKEYDGKPLTAPADITGLVDGETATVTATGSQTEVGSSTNTYSIDWGTTNKDNYTEVERLGTLTVTENTAEVKLKAPSAEKVYDGTALTAPAPVTVEGLPEGFTVDATASGSKTHAGTEPNVVNDGYKILNAAGEDKTANFTHVTKENGTLTVTKAPLTIETGSAEKKYDGTALRSSDYTVTGLVNGETVTVRPNGSQIAVGDSDNTYTMTWDTARVSDYEVTDKLGKLKVTAMDGEVVLIAPSDTKVYDGTALTADGTGTKKVTWTGLPTGFSVTATATGSQTDAGSSPNVVNDGYKILDATGTDVTGNYTNVRKEAGTLTVTPKEVTITTGSGSKEYDGTPLTKDEKSIDGLVSGESVTLTVTGSQTEVGESDNTYTIDWGSVNKDNYTVTDNLGTLTVTENDNAVVLKAPSAEKTYDGTALTAPGTEDNPVTATGLPDGFTVEASASGTITNAGERPNVVDDGWVIKDGNGNDVTEYFTNVTTEDGKLIVNKAPLTIKTRSAEKEYDGTALRNAEYDVDGLVNGETVTVIPNGSQTKVGSSDNTYTMTWDTARVENYEVTDELGTLTVTENTKAVKVIAPSAEKEYDGTALTAPGTPDNPIKTENLPAGHRIQATITGTQTDAGESANVIEDGWKILNGAGEDVTAYFTNKTKEDGTLKVTPKPLTITTDGAVKEYDGTPLTNEHAEAEGLVEGETITVTATGSQTELGESENTYEIDWGETKSGNYEIVEDLGLLRVIPFTGEIALRAASTQKTYDGTPLTRDEVIPSGLPGGFTVEAHAAGSQTDAGSTENVVQDGWIIRDKDGNDKTADFANVVKVNGTLTVNPKDLTITSGSASKTYDGTPLTNPDYTVSGLVGDETVTVTVTGSRTVVGSGENSFEVTWDNAKESNYTLTKNPGTLTVTPYERAVVLTAPSAEKVYDGTPLTKDGTDPEYPLIISGLPEGFRVETVIEGSATNVGDDGTNTITSYRIIRTENGADRTEFFTNVTLVDGNLTILPRPVVVNVTGNNDRVVYDRGEHSVEGYTTEISDPLYTEEYIDFEGEAKASGTNVGNYEMGLSEDRFANNNSNFDVTFSVNDGWLRIDPKSVTVVIAGIDVEKVYNGQEQTALEYEIVSISDDWVTEDEILLIPDRAGAKGTEVGRYPMLLAGENAPFECTDTNFEVDFVVTEGYLIITALEVTVTVDDGDKIYGDPDPEYEYEIPDLPDDIPEDKIKCTFTREPGEDVTEEGYVITPDCDSDEGSIIVDIVPGKLTIKPRPITITAASDSKVYDGTPLTNAGYEITEGTLAFDDALLSAVVTGSQTDAGSSENPVSDAVINGADGADVTENYEITYVPGTLTVERKKITVTAEHKEKIEGQPDPELTVIIDGLVPGDPEDIIDYTIDREPGEEPGDYPIHVDGDPEQGNYIVEFEPGTLTIHKNVSPVDIIVEVGWDDRNDLEGIRPATTTVYLYGNDELFGTVELGPNGYAVQKTIDETWSYTFFNMPRVDVNLEDIVYRVEEQRTDVLTGVDGPGTYAITEEEVEPYHFFITNTHTVPDVEFSVSKSWVGGESEHEPVTIRLLANGEPTDYSLVLSAENQWAGSFTGLPKYNEETRELLTYTIAELDPGDYDPLVRGNQESGFRVINYLKPVVPELFDFDIEELPATGITMPKSQLPSKPASIRYEPTSLLLQIPTLNVSTGIVTVPFEDGSFPVEYLGMDAGLLEGSDKPGEGISILAAHNTVNAEEIGPFVTIMKLKEGDRIFVTNDEGEVMIYEVYANAKIGANDMDGLEQYAAAYYNTLTLLTCEDERVEGGYASRRIVSARRVN